MFFLDKFLVGFGLNFTDIYNNKTSKVKNYAIDLIPKHDYILCDFENLRHTESELTNYSHAVKINGFLIIRQKNAHEECYNEMFFYNEILDSKGMSLIKFEVEENYCYYIFKKVKKLESLFIGAVINEKEKLISIVNSIANSEIAKNNLLCFSIQFVTLS